jgi:hypothetical protein
MGVRYFYNSAARVAKSAAVGLLFVDLWLAQAIDLRG